MESESHHSAVHGELQHQQWGKKERRQINCLQSREGTCIGECSAPEYSPLLGMTWLEIRLHASIVMYCVEHTQMSRAWERG